MVKLIAQSVRHFVFLNNVYPAIVRAMEMREMLNRIKEILDSSLQRIKVVLDSGEH